MMNDNAHGQININCDEHECSASTVAHNKTISINRLTIQCRYRQFVNLFRGRNLNFSDLFIISILKNLTHTHTNRYLRT